MRHVELQFIADALAKSLEYQEAKKIIIEPRIQYDHETLLIANRQERRSFSSKKKRLKGLRP